MIRRAILSFVLIIFWMGNVNALEKEAYYNLVYGSLTGGSYTGWTSFLYAGLDGYKEARAACLSTIGDFSDRDSLDEDEAVETRFGLGFDCLTGSFLRNGDGDGNLGSPLTSCAAVGGIGIVMSPFDDFDPYDVTEEKKLTQEQWISINSYMLAFVIGEYKDGLKFYKISRSLWERRLARFEDSMIKRLSSQPSKFYQTLFKKLNRVTRRIDRATNWEFRLRTIMNCGGGIFGVEVKVIPENAEVELVPKMFYDHCIDSGNSPDDPTCRKHFKPENLQDGDATFLSGVYVYRLIIDGVAGEFKAKDVGIDLAPAMRKFNTIQRRILIGAALADDERGFAGMPEMVVTFD